jgi:ribosomal protein S18 acetylase RimI-like enzyme
MQLHFREVQLLDLWRTHHPNKAVPPEVLNGQIKSWECVHDSQVVGHCNGHSATGEILGISVISAYQRQGIGRRLLSLLAISLRNAGAKRVWLAAPADPALSAYGFYRAVGWVPTGERTENGDKILELRIGDGS